MLGILRFCGKKCQNIKLKILKNLHYGFLFMTPFRWNLKRREQLGELLVGDSELAYPDYEHELMDCAVKVVARSSNRKIIFVGRSPENIFDLLSGVFGNSTQESDIGLLNISNRFQDIQQIKNTHPRSIMALKEYFTELEIAPKQLLDSEKGICFADLVAYGGTFEQLFLFLRLWSEDERHDFHSIVRKIGFIGITQRQKNSPNTWRWQQNADWVANNKDLYIKNVSVPTSLWDYLGNRQKKVARTNVPEYWGESEIMNPPRDENNLKSLRQAYHIYLKGIDQKKYISSQLSQTAEIREPWLRQLAKEIKDG